MKRIEKMFYAGVVMLLTACGGSDAQSGQQTGQTEIKHVTTATAELQNVEQVVAFTGTVEAEVVNNIAPQSALRIEKIYVEVGDRVRRGQKLADMDAASLEQARVQKENAEIEFHRADELYKIGGESKSTWDARKLDYDVASTSYANLLQNTSLVSPVSGIVTARNYDNGDMYAAGTPVVVVEQIRPVKLTIHISEGRFAQVKKGMEIGITTESYGDEQFKGHVNLIYPSLDPATRTFPVEIRIDNADERVRPGMFARATLSFGEAERVVVPDRAVVKQTGSGERFVFIVRNGQVEYTTVEIGQRVGDRFEILSGVTAGDVVVVTGQNRLRKGDAVQIVESEK